MLDKPLATVWGSHNPRPGSKEYDESEELGEELARNGFRVATGGYGGIMEGVLKGAGGGIGFSASIFSAATNSYATEILPSDDLFDRIKLMIDDSAALICLKGGTGTLLELAAAWELVNKKLVCLKPIICLGRFWEPVVNTLSDEPSIEGLGTLKNLDRSAASYIDFVETPEEAVALIKEKLGMS